MLRIAKQIFEGLEFMDRIGYCHRDIKPENIGFVRLPGVEDADLKLKPGDGLAEHLDQISVKLIDFGVAWRYREGMSKQTWWIGDLTENLEAPEEYAETCTDAVQGSQGHMAPEVRPIRTYRPLCTHGRPGVTHMPTAAGYRCCWQSRSCRRRRRIRRTGSSVSRTRRTTGIRRTCSPRVSSSWTYSSQRKPSPPPTSHARTRASMRRLVCSSRAVIRIASGGTTCFRAARRFRT